MPFPANNCSRLRSDQSTVPLEHAVPGHSVTRPQGIGPPVTTARRAPLSLAVSHTSILWCRCASCHPLCLLSDTRTSRRHRAPSTAPQPTARHQLWSSPGAASTTPHDACSFYVACRQSLRTTLDVLVLLRICSLTLVVDVLPLQQLFIFCRCLALRQAIGGGRSARTPPFAASQRCRP